MGALLRRARLSLSFCLPFLPPLSSFPTSLAATLRSAATNARSQHQLQQHIISVVINGDALGKCYRAACSFPLHRPAIASAISSPLAIQISFSFYSAILSLFPTHTHPLCSSSTWFTLSPYPRYFIPLRNCIPSVVKPRPASTESSRDTSLSANRFNCLSMPDDTFSARAIPSERPREKQRFFRK